MKALTLTLLALVLGVGSFLLLLDRDGGGRSSREAHREALQRTAGDEEAPAPKAQPARGAKPPAPARDSAAPARPSAGRSSVDATPALEARLVYEGTVVTDGGPVPGADLCLLRGDEPLGETRADERGRFRLSVPPGPEALLLTVRGRGFVPLERALPGRPSGGSHPLGPIRLVRGRLLAGRVVDARGSAIADAQVSAQPVNAGTDLLRSRGRSGPDGRFEIPDSPSGPLLVTARARGFAEQTVTRPSDSAPSLEICLQPGVELLVRLRTPRGAPVIGADVSLQSPRDSRPVAGTQQSDAEGRVRFEGLSAGSWNVRVTHPDYRTPARAEVQANGTEAILECTPWPAIEGIVHTSSGDPPPAGTKVHALPAAAPGDRLANLPGGREVDAQGNFRVGGLRPGDWRIRVLAPGFAPATSNPVKLGIEGDGHAGTILLTAAGRLRLELTSQGKPAGGAEVEIHLSAPRPALLWAPRREAGGAEPRLRSDRDGRVTLGDLVPGPVWVAVTLEGCPPTSWGPFEVGTEKAEPVRIDLPRGARLRGRVLAKGGRPYADAQLRITDPSGGLGFPLMLASGDDGSYTSAWLPAGHYRIEAFAPADPTLRSGAEELDLGPGEQRDLDLTL